MRKVAGVSGIVSQIVVITAILVALSRSPWFSWTENDLSVLGVSAASKLLFNGGLIFGGVFSFVFAFGLGRTLPPNRVTRFAIYVLMLGSIGFAAVGMLPEDTDLAHSVAVPLYFTCVTTALVLIGLVSIHSELKWGFFSLMAGILMVALHFVSWPWSGTAIPKLLYTVPWSLWTIYVGVILLAHPSLISGKRK